MPLDITIWFSDDDGTTISFAHDCPVCGNEHDENAIWLIQQLEGNVFLLWCACPNHDSHNGYDKSIASGRLHVQIDRKE